MQNQEKILELFGELFIKETRDPVINLMYSVITGELKTKVGIKLYENFKTLPVETREALKIFAVDAIDTALHYFLWMIEQCEDYDLVHYSEGRKTATSLRDISEMLCAEPKIEGGWIERFSKYPPSVT